MAKNGGFLRFFCVFYKNGGFLRVCGRCGGVGVDFLRVGGFVVSMLIQEDAVWGFLCMWGAWQFDGVWFVMVCVAVGCNICVCRIKWRLFVWSYNNYL